VAALERSLGGALFDRTTAGLTLTHLGEAVRLEAEAMAAALTRVTDAVSVREREVEGLVRIALTETLADAFVIPHVLPGLLRAHPRLRVDLVIGNTSADLARREADLALRFFLQPRGDLLVRRVARMATAVLASPKLARSVRRGPMSAWPFVATWMPGVTIPEEAWRQAHAPQEVRCSTNSFHAQVEAVRAGLGVAVLPVALARELSLEALTLPPTVPVPPPLDLYLVTPRTLRRVPRIAAAHAALEAAFGRLS
jgi:DNA-binding transcriptional LysR family regulator